MKEKVNEDWKRKLAKNAEKGRKKQQENKRKRIDEYNKNPKKCKYCGSSLTYEENQNRKRFCNHKCSALYNNIGNYFHSEDTKNKIKGIVDEKLICEKCGKSFNSRSALNGHRSHCGKDKKERISLESRKKQSNSLKEFHCNKNENIKKTLPFEYWPELLIKRTLFKENGNKCQECGYEYTDPITNKGPFEIHHLDGNNKNWKKENLKILCLNCHWKTPNYRMRGKRVKKETIEKMLKTSIQSGRVKNVKDKYKYIIDP